jgi:uncharacterized protein (DUF885 family)
MRLGPILLILSACGPQLRDGNTNRQGGDPAEEARFHAAAAGFYQPFLDLVPTEGLQLGYHQYDGKLPDLSATGLGRLTAFFDQQEQTFTAIDPARLGRTSRVERDVLLSQIRSYRFGLETRRNPWRSPAFYTEFLDMQYYVSQAYAPLETRARALIAACKNAGPLLAHAAENLEPRLPRTWLENGEHRVTGSIEFLATDVKTAFAGLAVPLAGELREATDGLARDLQHYLEALHTRDAAATDDFALGEEQMLIGLRTQGIENVDLATLRRIADENLARDLAAVGAAAHDVDPTRTSAEVMNSQARPAPAEVLTTARAQAASMRQTLIDKAIVTIPSDDPIEVRESPPFMRWNFAFMNSYGPFEPQALASFYFVTLPDPSWPDAQQRAYVRPTYALLSTTIHEVWPGHFLHFLHIRKNPSKILRSFGTYSTSEGWAHYVEEMMWDQHALGDDPRVRLGQLTDALLRDVRFVSALGLHTSGMTVEQSAALFREKAFTDEMGARQQANRGTFDPLYLSYTVGKLMIRKLREDWRAKVGARFSLKAFHDEFLSYAGAPIPTIRREMLGDNSPPL